MDTKQLLNVDAQVSSLIEKAAQAATSDDALKFSQAACNVADAARAVNSPVEFTPETEGEQGK
jgi:hypothetical protein